MSRKTLLDYSESENSQSSIHKEIKNASVYDHLKLGLLAHQLKYNLMSNEISNTQKLIMSLALHQIDEIQQHLADGFITESEIDEVLEDWTKLDEILNI